MSLFLFPSKSLTKYQIGNKEIIVIGEAHTNNTNINMADVEYTWDFMTQKLQQGYNIDIELSPNFNYNAAKQHIQSINIKNVLKNAEKINKKNKISGMDFRRKGEFFGIFGNENIQAYFFNKSSELNDINMWQLLVVLDNIMLFTNKHFYDKFRGLILKLNKSYLDNLFKLHQKVDKHSQNLKKRIQQDAQKTKKQLYTVGDTFNLLGKPRNFENIIDDMRMFVLAFSDLYTVIEIIYHKNNKHVLLIGDSHAQNMRYLLGNYIEYPNKVVHKKLSAKQKKMLGNEIKGKPNQVLKRFF